MDSKKVLEALYGQGDWIKGHSDTAHYDYWMIPGFRGGLRSAPNSPLGEMEIIETLGKMGEEAILIQHIENLMSGMTPKERREELANIILSMGSEGETV